MPVKAKHVCELSRHLRRCLALVAIVGCVAPARADRKEAITRAGDILQILLPAGGASYALKFTVHRVRPSFFNDPFIEHRYGEQFGPVLRYSPWLAAGLAGWSRVFRSSVGPGRLEAKSASPGVGNALETIDGEEDGGVSPPSD